MIVVFDLDGTLIDSAYDVATSANELVTTLGGAPLDLDTVINMIGEGAAVLVKRALTAAGLDPDTPDALARFLEIYSRHLLDRTQPYPGVQETLAIAAHRARLAILTNKPLAHTERILEGLRLRDFFSVVVGGDNPRGRKPDPAALLAIVAAAADQGALFVGDSPIDDQTARAAHVSFAWARYGFGSTRFGEARPETPYVLDAARDLLAILDRLDTVYSMT
jgi:phosphoglycolate phosphatase